MTTSKKHQKFASEPMGNKPVTDLPGIGPKLGDKLKEHGVIEASQVVGKFLAGGKNEPAFKEWLMGNAGGNEKQRDDCCKGVKEWCDNNA